MPKIIKDLLFITAFSVCFIAVQMVYMSYQDTELTRNDLSNVNLSSTHCDRLVMYSTTWCGACKMKRKELNASRIKYVEYLVDRDHAMNMKFESKLRKQKLPVYYPRLEVNGKFVSSDYLPHLEKKYKLCKT